MFAAVVDGARHARVAQVERGRALKEDPRASREGSGATSAERSLARASHPRTRRYPECRCRTPTAIRTSFHRRRVRDRRSQACMRARGAIPPSPTLGPGGDVKGRQQPRRHPASACRRTAPVARSRRRRRRPHDYPACWRPSVPRLPVIPHPLHVRAQLKVPPPSQRPGAHPPIPRGDLPRAHRDAVLRRRGAAVVSHHRVRRDHRESVFCPRSVPANRMARRDVMWPEPAGETRN